MKSFKKELVKLFQSLAQDIIKDAEGAKKEIVINVEKARNKAVAREVAFTIAQSPLVKTAMYGNDANWGRILAAVGRSKVEGVSFENINIFINDLQIIASGEISGQYTEDAGSIEMKKSEIIIRIDLGSSLNNESVWTTDLSYDYVKINAEYRS